MRLGRWRMVGPSFARRRERQAGGHDLCRGAITFLFTAMNEDVKPAGTTSSRVDHALAWIAVAGTAAIFWPVTRWVAAETTARQQIQQSALLLAAAAALIWWRRRGDELRVRAELGDRALALLVVAFALAGVAGWAGWPLLVLPAFACGVAGCLHALFGAAGARRFAPLVAGVALLLAIIVLFPLLDWPLRQLAAVGAAGVLGKAGLAPNLMLTGEPGNPQLVLSVAEGHFLVATECNGFGLITSGALVAILAGGIAGRRWWSIAGLALAGLAIGFVFNLLRILAISTTARYFPGHYNLLHETAGTLALWAGLGLIGWLAWRRERPAAVA